MRSFLSFLTLALFLVSCQESAIEQVAAPQKNRANDPNPFETAMYNCLVKQYSEQNLDLDKIHKELEDLAILTGNLADATAQSYYNMFKLAASGGHFPLSNEQTFFDELAKIPNFPLNLNCTSDLGIPDAVAKSSKMAIYNRLLSVEISKTRNKGLQPNTAIPIINSYSKEDFENKFVQVSMLGFIAYRTSIENKIYQ